MKDFVLNRIKRKLTSKIKKEAHRRDGPIRDVVTWHVSHLADQGSPTSLLQAHYSQSSQ